MNHVHPQRRPSRSQHALVLALVIAVIAVIAVNGGIAGIIDRLAGAGQAPAGMAVAPPTAATRG